MQMIFKSITQQTISPKVACVGKKRNDFYTFGNREWGQVDQETL